MLSAHQLCGSTLLSEVLCYHHKLLWLLLGTQSGKSCMTQIFVSNPHICFIILAGNCLHIRSHN